MLYSIMIFMLMATMSYPFMMIMLLVSVCVSLVITMSSAYGASWPGLVLSLVILGGLMILFLFMASMSKPVEFHRMKWGLLCVLLGLTFFCLFMLSFVLDSPSFIMSTSIFSNLFVSYKSFWFVFLIIYLLYSLVVVMELLLKIGAPVRRSS